MKTLNHPSDKLPIFRTGMTGSPSCLLGVFIMGNEIWKDIPEYEGYYQVSNYGNFRGLDRVIFEKTGKPNKIKGKPIKTHFYTNGYLGITFCKNGIKKQFIAHRIVAQMFVPNDNPLLEVNHKNEIKSDISANNLEWMTHKENSNYGTKVERQIKNSDFTGSKNPMFGIIGYNNKNSIHIDQFSISGEFIKTHASSAQIERDHGFNASGIIGVCRGRCKQAYGFVWRYKI